ncbi:MAG: hypothetical protein L3J36_03415 [Rhodobacteraceae bacterium]|nr:hypothetical protein [Paracoccaceae bacterium]
MNQIISMIMRILMRKAINSGINAGIGAASGMARRGKQKGGDAAPDNLSEGDRKQQQSLQIQAKQTKKQARMGRRISKF